MAAPRQLWYVALVPGSCLFVSAPLHSGKPLSWGRAPPKCSWRWLGQLGHGLGGDSQRAALRGPSVDHPLGLQCPVWVPAVIWLHVLWGVSGCERGDTPGQTLVDPTAFMMMDLVIASLSGAFSYGGAGPFLVHSGIPEALNMPFPTLPANCSERPRWPPPWTGSFHGHVGAGSGGAGSPPVQPLPREPESHIAAESPPPEDPLFRLFIAQTIWGSGAGIAG